MNGTIEEHIAALEAENARLRVELEKARSDLGMLEQHVDTVQIRLAQVRDILNKSF